LDLARTRISGKLAEATTGLLAARVEYGCVIDAVEGWMIEQVVELS